MADLNHPFLKNYKPSKSKQVNFKKTWPRLQKTVKEIITLGEVPRSTLINLYSDVAALCDSTPEPLGDKLYFETKKLLDNHVKELSDKVQKDGDLILLKSYYEAWNQYYKGINYLHQQYMYFNNNHIKNQKLSEADIIYCNPIPEHLIQMEIGELGLELWKVNILEPLRQKLVDQILLGIYQDRVGESGKFSETIISGVIESFVLVQDYKEKNNLDLYKEIFEEPFLKASGEYFEQESSRLFSECNVSQYIEKTSQRLDEVDKQIKKFLHSSSHVKARAQCEQYMVSVHLDVLHGECQQMVDQESRRDLAFMYNLIKNVSGGLPPLVEQIFIHIKQHALKALPNNSSTIGPLVPASSADAQNSSLHTQFVENLLAVHIKYNQMIEEVFKGDQQFINALDKAYNFVMNHKTNSNVPCRSPEMFSKYFDSLLKKSLKGISESQIEEKLSQAMRIFDYINDKDMFLKYYERTLAKRFLDKQSLSIDAEEAMISRLKNSCGHDFTNKLQTMFKDNSISLDLNNKFNNCMRDDNVELGINLSFNILQLNAWPIQQSEIQSFDVPQELERPLQMFGNFYHKQFKGRKLTWLHYLCQGELKLTFLKKRYLITMPTFQMAILLLFEKTNSLTSKELQETLQLDGNQFAKDVASLVDCKLLISNTPNILPETVLSLNMEYNNKKLKVKICETLQRDRPQQEIAKSLVRIKEERQLYLQAALCRIMKSRKSLKHNELIQEVLCKSKLSFAPEITLIKKSIGFLIDKQYIEMASGSTDIYNYVA